jgi:hypothetical protein
MAKCEHKALEKIGEQKDEMGVNVYYKCKACGEILVVTPEEEVFEIEGSPSKPSS